MGRLVKQLQRARRITLAALALGQQEGEVELGRAVSQRRSGFEVVVRLGHVAAANPTLGAQHAQVEQGICLVGSSGGFEAVQGLLRCQRALRGRCCGRVAWLGEPGLEFEDGKVVHGCGDAGLRRLPVPLGGLRRVGWHAQALGKQQAQVERSAGVTLLGGAFARCSEFGVVGSGRHAVQLQGIEPVLRCSVALGSGLL